MGETFSSPSGGGGSGNGGGSSSSGGALHALAMQQGFTETEAAALATQRASLCQREAFCALFHAGGGGTGGEEDGAALYGAFGRGQGTAKALTEEQVVRGVALCLKRSAREAQEMMMQTVLLSTMTEAATGAGAEAGVGASAGAAVEVDVADVLRMWSLLARAAREVMRVKIEQMRQSAKAAAAAAADSEGERGELDGDGPEQTGKAAATPAETVAAVEEECEREQDPQRQTVASFAQRMCNHLQAFQQTGRGQAAATADRSGFPLAQDELRMWMLEYFPETHRVFQAWVRAKLFPALRAPPGARWFSPPMLSAPSAILTDPVSQLLPLACADGKLQGPWQLLYTSVSDGLSFNRVANALLGFAGPTVVLVRDTGGAIFGGVGASQWQEATDFFGDSTSFVFRLAPTLGIHRARPRTNGHFQYLNTKLGYNAPHGLGFGGQLEEGGMRLFLAEDLDENSSTRERGMTFQSGPLASSPGTFSVDCLEVYGCGGEEVVLEALRARAAHRARTAHTLNQARKVDRAKFLENDFDKEFLFSQTYGHRQAAEKR